MDNSKVFKQCKGCKFFVEAKQPFERCTRHGYLIDLDGSIKVDCPLVNVGEVRKGADNIIKTK